MNGPVLLRHGVQPRRTDGLDGGLPPVAPSQREARGALEHLVVINDDCFESGGAASIALSGIRAMRQRGIKVTMLTGDATINAELDNIGASVVRLGGQHLLEGARAKAAMRGLFDPGTRHELGHWIACNDTPGTIYHLHNWHKYLSPSVFLPLRRISHRLVFSQHDFFLVCPNGGFYDYPRAMPCERRPMSAACLLTACDKRSRAHKAWRVVRQSVRNHAIELNNTSATILAVHEGMRPLLERGGIASERIRILRNPVTPWLQKRVDAAANSDFLYVGRLDADKGIDVLARAARLAGVRLRVVGDGPLAPWLADTHPEIELLGRLPSRAIAEVAVTARCVVVPTIVRETFGLVAMEALTSGIPVIITDTAFIAREVVEAGMGLTCRSGDVASLAAQISNVARDDELADALSRAAHAVAPASCLTIESWSEELLRIYCECLDRTSQPLRDVVQRGVVET